MDHARKRPYQNYKLCKINLKLLLKWDRRTPTDLVHQRLSILNIDDVHIAKVLSFVKEYRSCRFPEMFVNYYKIRETGLNLRCRSSLDIPWARTDLGLSRCDIKGALLWNNYLQTTSQLLYKKSFHKQLSKFFIVTSHKHAHTHTQIYIYI